MNKVRALKAMLVGAFAGWFTAEAVLPLRHEETAAPHAHVEIETVSPAVSVAAQSAAGGGRQITGFTLNQIS